MDKMKCNKELNDEVQSNRNKLSVMKLKSLEASRFARYNSSMTARAIDFFFFVVQYCDLDTKKDCQPLTLVPYAVWRKMDERVMQLWTPLHASTMAKNQST